MAADYGDLGSFRRWALSGFRAVGEANGDVGTHLAAGMTGRHFRFP